MEIRVSHKTLVVGASSKSDRYSYKATRSLLAHGHEPVLLGLRAEEVMGLPIHTGQPAFEGIHTITMYINPKRQPAYYDYLLNLNPERIIFNPGTENHEFYRLARERGILVEEACTLVLLSTDQFVSRKSA